MHRRVGAFPLFVVLLVGGGLLVACGTGTPPPTPAASVPVTPGAVVSEHRFKPLAASSSATLAQGVGADCGEYGAASCQSGLCIHASLARGRGYVCSKQCTRGTDCPSTWACVQTYPAEDARFCVPEPQTGVRR
jgi:hypothetical protein